MWAGTEKQGLPCPEDSASLCSHVLFSWIGPLLREGYRRPLNEGDVFEPPASDHIGVRTEQIRASLAQSASKSEDERDSGTREMLRALLAADGGTFMRIALLRPIWLACVVLQVVSLRFIVSHVEDGTGTKLQAVLVALGLGVLNVLQSISINHLFYWASRVGQRARNSLSLALYRKALRLSTAGLSRVSAGAVLNLCTNDTDKIFWAAVYFHFLWSGVVEIAVVLTLLSREVGVSALAAVAVIACVIPTQVLFARAIGALQGRAVRRTDSRTRKMHEILGSIQLVKLYAWEDSFATEVARVRSDEVRLLRRTELLKSANTAIFNAAPLVAAAAAFATHTLRGEPLTAATAFAALGWVNLIMRSLIMLPRGAQAAVEGGVALRRLHGFLQLEERAPRKLEAPAAGSGEDETRPPLRFADHGFVWGEDDGAEGGDKGPVAEPSAEVSVVPMVRSKSDEGDHGAGSLSTFTLRQVSLTVRPGELCAVVGGVAAGKSSLLLAALGEMPAAPNTASEPPLQPGARVAYVPQSAWVVNASLWENVVMGRPWDAARYKRVLHACCLDADVETLPAGDATEIGERGVTLSGGQKQRVGLARACYTAADVYLLDDVLSALDARVGRRVFERCLGPNGLLRDAAVVLVTHARWCLPLATSVALMVDGTVARVGPYAALKADDVLAEWGMQEGEEEEEVMVEEDGAAGEGDSGGAESGKGSGDGVSGAAPIDVGVDVEEGKDEEVEVAEAAAAAEAATAGQVAPDPAVAERTDSAEAHKADPGVNGRVTELEQREERNVTSATYATYARAMGGFLVAGGILALFVAAQVVRVLCDWWVAQWTASALSGVDADGYRIGYGGLVLAFALLATARAAALTSAMLRAGTTLHTTMFARVLSAPMRFFWANPAGRILNRFSKDMDHLDKLLVKTSTDFLNFFFIGLGALGAILSVMPVLFALFLPLALLFVQLARFYARSSRQLKRLDGVTRSPVYNTFSATLAGLSTIRALGLEPTFDRRFERTLERNHSAMISFLTASRWVGTRLDSISACLVLACSLVGVLAEGYVSAGLLGVVLAQALQMAGIFQYAIRQATETENLMTSAERVAAYGRITTEEEVHAAGAQASGLEVVEPPAEWPQRGAVTLDGVALRYAEHLPPALTGVSAAVAAREKLGIVGRTGHGKSTLGVALFRLVPPSAGRVLLDGVDTASVPLPTLRRRLAIVPQDPVLFNGSVRSNLDPFGEREDEALWRVLKRVHLAEAVTALPRGLDAPVVEGGTNFSVGQRQLLCMGRALLREARILYMDEATANVSPETDALIQQTIREAFVELTVLTVAHRLDTVMDSDRILVMRNGRVAELGSPEELLQSEGGLFAELARSSGLGGGGSRGPGAAT